MSNITLDTLRTQLAQFEAQSKEIESNLYRIDGAIQVVKHLIKEAEVADAESSKPASDADVKPAPRLKAVKPPNTTL